MRTREEARPLKGQPPFWPRVMRRELAASYLSISPGIFDREVRAGKLPKPISITVGINGWVKDDLDAAIEDRRNAKILENDWD